MVIILAVNSLLSTNALEERFQVTTVFPQRSTYKSPSWLERNEEIEILIFTRIVIIQEFVQENGGTDHLVSALWCAWWPVKQVIFHEEDVSRSLFSFAITDDAMEPDSTKMLRNDRKGQGDCRLNERSKYVNALIVKDYK